MRLTKFKSALMAVAVICLSGCVTRLQTVPLKDATTLRTASGSLKTVTAPAPLLTNSQSSKALLGTFGTAINYIEGEILVEKGVIKDPSLSIETKLSEFLVSKTNLTASSPLIYEKRKDVPKASANEDGYVIDAETEVWGLSYFPFNWSKYQAFYNGNIRLINPEGKVIVSTNCIMKHPEKPEDSPDYDGIVRNDGAVLNEYLHVLADKCIEKFKSKTLSDL